MSEYGYITREVKEKIDPGEGWNILPCDDKTHLQHGDEAYWIALMWHRIEPERPVLTVKEACKRYSVLAIRRRKPTTRYGFTDDGREIKPEPDCELIPQGNIVPCHHRVYVDGPDGGWSYGQWDSEGIAEIHTALRGNQIRAYARRKQPEKYDPANCPERSKNSPGPCRCSFCGQKFVASTPFTAEAAAELKRAREKHPAWSNDGTGHAAILARLSKLVLSTTDADAYRRCAQGAAMFQRFAEDVLGKGGRE